MGLLSTNSIFDEILWRLSPSHSPDMTEIMLGKDLSLQVNYASIKTIICTVQLGYSECKQTEPLFCDR